MSKLGVLSGRTYRQLMSDRMRRNSLLLIASQAVTAGCLFLFWVIDAHIVSASTVGLATSLVSFGLLVGTFTNLGLPNTVIRFLPTSKRRGGLFAAALNLTTIASLFGSVLALLLVKHLVPKLAFIRGSASLIIIFIVLVVGSALSNVLDGALVAFRRGELVLIRSLFTNLPRIVLPFVLVRAAGVKGMAGIYAGTVLLGVGVNLYSIFGKLLKGENLKPTLGEVGKHRSYAASNYFGGLFGVLPSTLVPIIILARLGPANAAYYYMPAQIALFLSVVCNAISQAFISEAAQTEDVEAHKLFFRKALRHQYQVLIPIVLLLCLLGWPVLLIYGHTYVRHGFVPLLILAGSSLVVGLNWLGDTWLNVQKRSRDYFLMNAFNSVAVVGLVYIFAKHGLVAAALGWLLGQTISAAVYLIIFARGPLLGIVRTS